MMVGCSAATLWLSSVMVRVQCSLVGNEKFNVSDIMIAKQICGVMV